MIFILFTVLIFNKILKNSEIFFFISKDCSREKEISTGTALFLTDSLQEWACRFGGS